MPQRQLIFRIASMFPLSPSVDAIAKSVERFGEGANKMQTGNLSIMLRWMVGGFVILLLLALAYRF